MKTAGVKEARDRFSAYLDEVRCGEELVITEHGKPVAMLIPIGGSSKETLAYWRAVADGTIEQQTSPAAKPMQIKWPHIDLTDAQVQQALDDERDE